MMCRGQISLICEYGVRGGVLAVPSGTHKGHSMWCMPGVAGQLTTPFVHRYQPTKLENVASASLIDPTFSHSFSILCQRSVTSVETPPDNCIQVEGYPYLRT
jgi:hypothetical protein